MAEDARRRNAVEEAGTSRRPGAVLASPWLTSIPPSPISCGTTARRRGPLPWAASRLGATRFGTPRPDHRVRSPDPGGGGGERRGRGDSDAPASPKGAAASGEDPRSRPHSTRAKRPPTLVGDLRASWPGPGPVVPYRQLGAYQGVELLVDAAAELPEAWFVFMGGEPAGIAALRARSRAGARCVFVGPRPPSDLAAFLGLADVVVSPRVRGENTPFKVYTYLASGKPLVATRLPTHTQLIDDSMAFLVEPTAAGLAGGIRAALADPEGAAQRAAQGRALIERDYSAERFAEKVERAYADLSRK